MDVTRPETEGRRDTTDVGRDKSVTARVLVVDDSPTLRAVVARILEHAGHVVSVAEDGVAALGILSRERFDVVVSDLSMPGLDGFDLLRAVRAFPEPPEVILLTGTHGDDFKSAVRALRLGAHDYLVKPPRPEELLHAVGRATETRRLRDENRRLLVELERLTRADPLTQAGNRRAFDDALRLEASRARRYRTPLGIAIFDLDQFKWTNDTFGHAGGDEVLRAFADRAREVFRDADVFFRLGGEEFAVLLPFTDSEGAVVAAERLLAALREAPVGFGDRSIPVTASAGVACLGPDDEDVTLLLERADAALNRAKEGGRNRVRAAATPAGGEGPVLAPAASSKDGHQAPRVH